MKPRILFFTTICFLSSLIFSSCVKDDNEAMPKSTVSRLYVSNADTDASVNNTLIFDPANQAKFSEPYKFNSQLPDGNGILFDPYSGVVYQVSRVNKNIKTFKVNTDGSLVLKSSFIHEGLLSAREIAFDRSRDILYISSNIDSAIYVYNKVSTLKDIVLADKKLKLNGEPWGIHLDNDRLFVVIDQTRAEVQLFESASALAVGQILPTKKITVSGARRLHGITYSSSRDVLILTDIAEATATGFDTDGSIHIITDANSKFTESGSPIAPSRTIRGALTGLGNPVDVAWDDREGKDLIYIAEKARRKILVFNYSATGNIAPSVIADLSSSPEAIYLDAR